MIGLAGISVSRVIPENTLLGLLSGAYSLHGGVVRDMGGRIVAHMAAPSSALSLLPGLGWVADAFQTYQLHKMGLVLARVETQLGTLMKVSAATVALSGLGLVVSVAGFALLSRKLNELNVTLGRIELNTRKTNQFLQAVQYSQLKAAVDNLRHARETTDPNTRRDCLMSSKNDFGQLVHQYPHLWSQFEDLNELQALDDGYSIAMVGLAQATSDLGMGQVALHDFATHRMAWQHVARNHCTSKALKTDPQRLIHHRYLSSMPADSLLKLLDFAHQTNKGVQWLDELRAMESDASLLRLPKFGSEDAELEFVRKLVARDDVLAGYESHLNFLVEQDIRSCDFQAKVQELADNSPGTDPVWVVLAEPIASNLPATYASPIEEPAPATWMSRVKKALGFEEQARLN
jgi:hypothetical protein